MYSSQIQSQNLFVSPLKGYISPSQPASIQSSNQSAGNLDDQVKAIQMQYQFVSSYGLPQQGGHTKNASSSSVIMPNSFNQSYLAQTQIGSVTGNTLKSSSYLQQQGINNAGVASPLINYGITAQKNGSIDQTPYSYNTLNANIQSNIATTSQKTSISFQNDKQGEALNNNNNWVGQDMERDNLRMKVDEIVNQARKNVSNSLVGSETRPKYIGDSLLMPNQQSTPNPITHLKSPLQISPPSSELYQFDKFDRTQQGLQNIANYNLKSDVSNLNQLPSYTAYDRSNKIQSASLQMSLTSSLPVAYSGLHQENVTEQKNQYYASPPYLGTLEQQRSNPTSINQPTPMTTGVANQLQLNQNQSKQQIVQDGMQQTYNSQLKYTPQLNSQYPQNDITSIKHNYSSSQSMNNSSNNISNYFNHSAYNPNNSKHENPLSSNFEKASLNNEVLSGVSPKSNHFLFSQGFTLPQNLQEQKLSNIQPSQVQTQSFSYSNAENTIKNQPITNIQNTNYPEQHQQQQQQQQLQQQQYQQQQNEQQKNENQYKYEINNLQMQISEQIEDKVSQQNNEDIQIKQSPQKQSTYYEQQNSLNNQFVKNAAQSPYKREVEQIMNNQFSEKKGNDQISQQDSNDQDCHYFISAQNNTFETVQNDPQDQDNQEEDIVKRSKQQNSPSKSQNISPTKTGYSQSSKKKENSPGQTKIKNLSDDIKESITVEDFKELNSWLDPVFQDFVKKNFTKQQKKILIEQLSKQIQSDSEDVQNQEENNQTKKKKTTKRNQNDLQKSNNSKSPKGSPSSEKNKQNVDSKKKTLNLYERYNQLKSENKNTSPQNQKESDGEQPNMSDLENQAKTLSQIKEIRTEEEQREYIQFSQRCKAELERQKIIKHQNSKKDTNQIKMKEDNIQGNNSQAENRKDKNQKGFESIQSIESENCIMTRESKILLQEIYNEVQNALKKYDYIIQENHKNRTHKEQNKKETNHYINVESNSLVSDTLNLITTNSLKTSHSQKRFETQNQDVDDQSINKQTTNKHIPKKQLLPQGKNFNQSQNRHKQQIDSNGKGLPSLHFQSDSPCTSSMTSPKNQIESSPIMIQQTSSITDGTILVNQFEGVRISKMEENEAENAFNYRRQEIYKALQNNKQRKNSAQIQQKPMNHSQSKSNVLSHVRTPSNSASQRNSQVFQNHLNEDLNSSVASGFKQKSSNLLNKFLSPKHNTKQNSSSKDIENLNQSLKSSIFAGKVDNQLSRQNQHFEKNSYQLTDQVKNKSSIDQFESSKQLQILEFGDKNAKIRQKTSDESVFDTAVHDSIIPQEKVKRSNKQNDESKQKTRKKSVLHINLIEKEAYEINLGNQENKSDKKKIIKDRKQRVQQIYDEAQHQINIEEQKIIQKKSQNLILPISDPKIEMPNQEEDDQISSNTYRYSSQNQIQQDRVAAHEETPSSQGISKRVLKRSNSEQYTIFQQKKLAILHDIEGLNKLIEKENEVETQLIQQNEVDEQTNNNNINQIYHNQNQIHFNQNYDNQNENFQEDIQQYQVQQQNENKQGKSRQSSKPQSQNRSRNSSIVHDFQRPHLQGFVQVQSVTELAVDHHGKNDNKPSMKMIAPPIPLMKIRDQDVSDIQSNASNNGNNKEKFLNQIQQIQQQQNITREVKRVNSQHTIQNKDHTYELKGYAKQHKKESPQKENMQSSAQNFNRSKIPLNNDEQEYQQLDLDDDQRQINIYRSLSPNRYQNNGGISTNFHERNKKWLEIKKNKMEKTQKNYNNNEMKECTFKPQTNKQLIKYNPYVHKEQIKQKNVTPQNTKVQKNNSPRITLLQKNTQNQYSNQDIVKHLNTHPSKAKKEQEDLAKMQGLQSPIMQGYSEVEFWSQSDASVFKAINDIDTSYQAELKKEINDVLDIIQGFQVENLDKLYVKKSTSAKKSQIGSGSKQLIPSKLKKQ